MDIWYTHLLKSTTSGPRNRSYPMSHVYFTPVFGLMPVQRLMYFEGSLSCLLNSCNNTNMVDNEYFPFGPSLPLKTPCREVDGTRTSYSKENNCQWKNMKEKKGICIIWQKKSVEHLYSFRSQSIKV